MTVGLLTASLAGHVYHYLRIIQYIMFLEQFLKHVIRVATAETKMKPTRGNGTPYPKGRRSSTEEHSQSHDESYRQATHYRTKSSLQKMLDVHTQVTQTLHQIDTTVLNIHKLASSNHVADAEVQDFVDALANIDANLQDLNTLLRASAERSSLLLSNLDREPSHESTPPRNSVSPLITNLELGAISYSPLVATDSFPCGESSPCDSSESLLCTPPGGCTHRSTSSSPLPQTPCMLSPPRSTRVLSTISESPATPKGPAKEELSTTSNGGASGCRCLNPWVFETPPSARHGTSGEHLIINDGFFLLSTPGFGVSPPRTCNPLLRGPGEAVLSTEGDNVPPTPVMQSPFRTPGILFECSSGSRESSCSAGSPAILDDLTSSTVKRLGPRGLEERLWQELAIRKADVLLPVKFR